MRHTFGHRLQCANAAGCDPDALVSAPGTENDVTSTTLQTR